MREPIDVERACEQHAAYEQCLRELGLEVTSLPALSGHPDAVFVEDVAIVLDDLAIITTPGAASRRDERESVATVLATRRELHRLSEDARLDGGDVLVVGDVLHVGRSTRTNDRAVDELTELLSSRGIRVQCVPVHGCLHLKTACTSLGDGTVLVHRAWIDAGELIVDELVDVPASEPGGANVVVVGEAVVASASFPETAELLRQRGHELQTVALDELEKAEAGPTCLSLLLS